jgi:aminomuconate-semialdehyde/2-hydroxymuconate-6-semialdehyde dehydrogenase
MDVVLAFQSSKKLLAAPVRSTLQERVAVIQNLLELVSESSLARKDLIAEIIKDRLAEVAEFEKLQFSPSGLVSIILPWTYSFTYLIKAFVPAFLAGNHVVIKTSSSNREAGQQFSEMLEKLHAQFSAQQFVPGSVQVLHGLSEAVGELFAAHPSIRTVVAWGHLQTGQKISASAQLSFKKIHIGMGYNNAAFVLGEVTESHLQTLTEACFKGLGQSAFNINKVFVLESQHEQFLKSWRRYFETFWKMDSEKIKGESALAKYHSQVRQLTGERGKVSFGGRFQQDLHDPTVLLDLTHCSTLQQDELNCPMVIVSPVKYLHEMSKWANTSYFGQYSLLLGDREKAAALIAKLETGFHSINEWPLEKLLRHSKQVGMKQSFLGIANLTLESNLFSDKKTLV